MVPINWLTMSFIRVPPPTSPRKKLRFPMAARSVSTTASNTERSPAHRNINWPFSAGTLLPDTGASRKVPPRARTADAVSAEICSVSVAQSTNALPGRIPLIISSEYTAFTASGVESIAYVKSQDSSTSFAESATRTLGSFSSPSSTNSDTSCFDFSVSRFHTSNFLPDPFTKFRAIGYPMIPNPINPTLLIIESPIRTTNLAGRKRLQPFPTGTEPPNEPLTLTNPTPSSK
mmetsp:Transcript_4134/g.7951  ORF Transcript_4134/g.7951 Transcript_4134/m.7951 type:complete len:232 (-) Transcript_4134:84-779(-)